MIIIKLANKFIILIAFTVLLYSCDNSITNTPTESPVPAPSRYLLPSEIMALQGITSIHYIDLYHVTTNGNVTRDFVPSHEYHIDTHRLRMNQYYLGTPDWNITVYDLINHFAWNLYSGKLTYPQLPDLGRAYEINVQARLGSWLSDSQIYVRSEYIDDKLCDVFTDSTGTIEWVWQDYRLPIQRRIETVHRGIHQITYVRKRNIGINEEFSDSLFIPS